MGEPARRRYTWEEYLAFEERSEVRHEFVDGEIVAMAGGTPAHADLTSGVGRHLGNALEGTPCRVYSPDLRIRIADAHRSRYPDVSAVCGGPELDREDRNAVVNPIVLVEVLSEGSEQADRGAKWFDYQRIPSLRHYLLVSQWEPRVEHFARRDDGTWTYRSLGPGEVVELTRPDARLAVDDLYRGVALSERPPEPDPERRI